MNSDTKNEGFQIMDKNVMQELLKYDNEKTVHEEEKPEIIAPDSERYHVEDYEATFIVNV